jgi:hypothetical protein
MIYVKISQKTKAKWHAKHLKRKEDIERGKH